MALWLAIACTVRAQDAALGPAAMPSAFKRPLASSQDGQNTALAQLRRRFPAHTVDEASLVTGDLDGDGIMDHAALLDGPDSKGPLVAVVLGAAGGGVADLVAASREIPLADGNRPRLSLTHASLYLERGGSGGCCSSIVERFQFRWRDHNLQLVGLEYSVLANGDRRDDHGQNINLLTGDVVNWTDKGRGRRARHRMRAPLIVGMDGFDYAKVMTQLGPLP